MKILWKELEKITKQVQAKANIFGYKSTEANQLFLLYCFNGKIFFTDKIHPQVKYLWYGSLAFQILMSYFVFISHLWYGFEKDLMTLFDVINLLVVCNNMVFGLPLVSYWFRTDIESMIEGVDKIYTLKSKAHWENCKNTINVKKILLLNVNFFCVNWAVSLVYLFDVMLFFEKEKLDNRYNYPGSAPLVETFRSVGNYLIFNFLMNIIFTQICSQCLLFISFILYWGTTCSNALICAANEINTVSNNLNSHAELMGIDYKTWNQDFTKILKHNIKRFQKITRATDNFRGYFQVIGTVVIPASFFVALGQLHVALLVSMLLIQYLIFASFCHNSVKFVTCCETQGRVWFSFEYLVCNYAILDCGEAEKLGFRAVTGCLFHSLVPIGSTAKAGLHFFMSNSTNEEFKHYQGVPVIATKFFAIFEWYYDLHKCYTNSYPGILNNTALLIIQFILILIL